MHAYATAHRRCCTQITNEHGLTRSLSPWSFLLMQKPMSGGLSSSTCSTWCPWFAMTTSCPQLMLSVHDFTSQMMLQAARPAGHFCYIFDVPDWTRVYLPIYLPIYLPTYIAYILPIFCLLSIYLSIFNCCGQGDLLRWCEVILPQARHWSHLLAMVQSFWRTAAPSISTMNQ